MSILKIKPSQNTCQSHHIYLKKCRSTRKAAFLHLDIEVAILLDNADCIQQMIYESEIMKMDKVFERSGLSDSEEDKQWNQKI